MTADDIVYYRQRAITERDRARDCACEDAAAVHMELALLYGALLRQEAASPPRAPLTATMPGAAFRL